MTLRLHRAGALAACALLAAACGTAPKESFYTLAGPQAPLPAQLAASPAIFVGPVIVPESVDRTPMVIRKGANEVDIEDFHRWAEPLKTAIPRVVAETLMRELGTSRVLAARAASGSPVDYRVAIEIQRFDSSLQSGAIVDAYWTITPTKGGAAKTGRTVAQEPAPTPNHAGVAAAHSKALERVAKDIAAALK